MVLARAEAQGGIDVLTVPHDLPAEMPIDTPRAADPDGARTAVRELIYIWNRKGGIRANVNPYHHMHLVLADDAIAPMKSRAGLVPQLKAAFPIGAHCELHQAEALHPARYSDIVDDVTIDLARMMEHARAGQVPVGDFRESVPLNDRAGVEERIDAVEYIERPQGSLERLRGLEIAGARIASLKCYLTGRRTAPEATPARGSPSSTSTASGVSPTTPRSTSGAATALRSSSACSNATWQRDAARIDGVPARAWSVTRRSCLPRRRANGARGVFTGSGPDRREGITTRVHDGG